MNLEVYIFKLGLWGVLSYSQNWARQCEQRGTLFPGKWLGGDLWGSQWSSATPQRHHEQTNGETNMDTVLITFLLPWSNTMTRSNSREKELVAYGSRMIQPTVMGWGIRALGSWTRKLRDHIFSHTQWGWTRSVVRLWTPRVHPCDSLPSTKLCLLRVPQPPETTPPPEDQASNAWA